MIYDTEDLVAQYKATAEEIKRLLGMLDPMDTLAILSLLLDYREKESRNKDMDESTDALINIVYEKCKEITYGTPK